MLRLLGNAASRTVASRLACASAAGTALALQQQPSAAASCESSWFAKRESYHLRYFNARGVVETARLVMVLGGAQFTDERWELNFSKPRDEMSPGMTEVRTCKSRNTNDCLLRTTVQVN